MQVILESLSVLWILPWKDSLSIAVWCVFAAAVFARIYLSVRRASLGKVLAALQRFGCTTPETALSAQKLGISTRFISKQEKLIEQVECDGETRYYLPDDRKKKAEYFKKAAGGKIWLNLLSVLAAYLVMVLAYYLLPSLFEIWEAIPFF